MTVATTLCIARIMASCHANANHFARTRNWRETTPGRVIVHALPRRSSSLEELDRTLVPLGRRTRFERSEISSLSALRISLPRVESVLARPQHPDHRFPLTRFVLAKNVPAAAARRTIRVDVE
jgi:hypothetical protein